MSLFSVRTYLRDGALLGPAIGRCVRLVWVIV